MARPVRDPFANDPIPGQTTVEEQVAEVIEESGLDEFVPNQTKPRTANQRYGAAQAALRAAHPEEFQHLLERQYAADGLTYRVRRTAEERAALEQAEKRAKAQAKIDALRAEFDL